MANGRLFLRENYLGGTGLLRINTSPDLRQVQRGP